MLGGANSGQTSIKLRDLTCDVEPPPLKNCKDMTMKLEVEYLFTTSSSGANFYIYQVPEGLGMRKTADLHPQPEERLGTSPSPLLFLITLSIRRNWVRKKK